MEVYPYSLTLKAPITTAADDIQKYIFPCFSEKLDLMFQVNPLLGRGLTWKIKPYFLQTIKVNKTCHRDRIARLTAPCPSHKQEGQEALNRSPEYTDQKSNI